ncbi:hypothetical protein B0H11DRAFT_2210513 [Mycena galericulata]|nr:hypothetical protein B0H11DRAFT_2210513 [Mycena galericulata]
MLKFSRGRGVFLGTLVQMFYAYRIWALSHRSPYIPLLIIIVSLGGLSLSIVYTVKATITKAFDNTGDVIPFSTSSLSLEVACDSLISGGMVYNLWKGRSEYKRTNRALNILIAYTINSGMLTTVFAACTLIFVSNEKPACCYEFNSGGYAVPGVKVHTHLLVLVLYPRPALNSREYVRQQLNPSHEMVTIPTTRSRAEGSSNNPEAKALDSAGTVVFAKRQEGISLP